MGDITFVAVVGIEGAGVQVCRCTRCTVESTEGQAVREVHGKAKTPDGAQACTAPCIVILSVILPKCTHALHAHVALVCHYNM